MSVDRKMVAIGSLLLTACGDASKATAPPPPNEGAPPAALALASARACADGDPTGQRHGATCLCCHSDEFGVAGSVDPTGPPIARVVVTDATGDTATMVPNAFANFFRHFPMTPPFRAAVYAPDGRALEMRAAAPSADCNRCHFTGGSMPILRGPGH
jgi:hypothetical protein